MSGVPWFKFFSGDWLTDTRELSDRAKGCYIDLLAATYNQGAPLAYDEKYLAQLCGYGNVRSLRFVLRELLKNEKFTIVESDAGKVLVNNRAMEEIEKRNEKIANSAKGGKSKSARNGAEMGAKPSPLQAEIGGSFIKKQPLNLNQPEPEPERKDAVSKDTGVNANPVKALFDLGVDILTQAEKSESQARSLVGKWRKKLSDEKLAPILITAKSKTDPAAYIIKAVEITAGRCEGKAHPDADKILQDARLKDFRDNGYWDDAWGQQPDISSQSTAVA